VAADQSVSVIRTINGEEQTSWTELDSKLLRISGHPLVVASAGTATINGIPVLRIVNRWASQLIERPQTLVEYAASFLQWYAQEHPTPDATEDDLKIRLRIRRIFRTFTPDANDNARIETSEVQRLVNLWISEEPTNLFANPDMSLVVEALKGDVNAADAHKRQAVLKIVPKVNGDLVEAEVKRIAALIEAEFDSTFGEPFDPSNSWDTCVRDLIGDYIVRHIDDEGDPASLLFIGYGESEWTPSLVTLDMQDHGALLPRVSFVDASTPEHVWYMSLARREQVITFLTGRSLEFHDTALELLEAAGDNVGDGKARLESVVDHRVSRNRSKIQDLSVEKLEFVARSFVELESLGAFLVESLPSVGGEVEVISMTR